MSDEMSAHESGCEGETNNEPGTDTPQSQKQIIKRVLPEVLEVLGVFAFGIAGTAFTEVELHIAAFVCDFLAFACGIVIFSHITKELLGKHRRKCLILLLILDFAFFAGLVSYFEKIKADEANKPKQSISIAVHDLVPNTKTTYSHLQTEYPYGYAVFFANGNRMVFESPSLDTFHWSINFQDVHFNADFSRHMYQCTISNYSGSGPIQQYDRPTYSNTLSGITSIGNRHPMDVGPIWSPRLESMHNEPAIFYGMLGDDQKNYVFVLGFRIAHQPNSTPPLVN